MKSIESLCAEIQRLCLRAVVAKINLQELSTKLPAHWERIPAAAAEAFSVHQELLAAHGRLKALRASAGHQQIIPRTR